MTMKTTIKLLTVVTLMFGTLIGHATELELNINPKTKITTILQFTRVKKGHQITIKNLKDRIVHTETIERNGDYVKKFDFSSLEDGQYVIELEKDFEIIIRPFEIKDDKVFFNYAKQKSVFKPVVRTQDNKVLISILNLDSDPMDVEIYYGDESIYTEKASGDQLIERVYALSKELKGTYKAVIKTADRTYVQSFQI